MDVKRLERKLSLAVKDQQLFHQAFTHSSYVNEHQHKQLADNERLEFLGDAVLELIVSDYLFKRYKRLSEGELTKLRAAIVCEESLYRFSKRLQFDRFVLLGKGEERAGGRQRQSLLADVFEAFLGALYIDQGLSTCTHFLEKQIFPHLSTDVLSYTMDFKTELQEYIQTYKESELVYNIVAESGPSHAKRFQAEVKVLYADRKESTIGEGKTKKEAEQKAAENMLKLIKDV